MCSILRSLSWCWWMSQLPSHGVSVGCSAGISESDTIAAVLIHLLGNHPMTPTRTYDRRIAQQLNLKPVQVQAAIDLLDAGNTLPFIARYRKEVTQSLDEDQLRQLFDLLGRLRAVDERRDAILASITEQGKLTPELDALLQAAESLTELEDLYQPYKPKRRTRASIARERGLQPLADLSLTQARADKTPE